MKKTKCAAWILMFIGIMIIPHILWFFLGQYVDTTNYENRNMAERPLLSTNTYLEYPKQYEAYFNDNVPFRNQLIRLNNMIDYYLFNQSSNDEVVIGKEDWLFYNTGGIEQALGAWQYTEEDLQLIADNMETTRKILEAEGIEFILFIAPNKSAIYTEYLPDYYHVINEVTPTEQIVSYLRANTNVRVIYPKDELILAKETFPDVNLFHQADTHWNMIGGYVGTCPLLLELGIEMPALRDIEVKPGEQHIGDLTRLLNIPPRVLNVEYQLIGTSEYPAECDKDDPHSEHIYHTSGMDDRRVLMFSDSFCEAMAPTIAAQFNNCWFVRVGYEQEKIFDYDTDIFILETIERNVNFLKEFSLTYIEDNVIINEDGSP